MLLCYRLLFTVVSNYILLRKRPTKTPSSGADEVATLCSAGVNICLYSVTRCGFALLPLRPDGGYKLQPAKSALQGWRISLFFKLSWVLAPVLALLLSTPGGITAPGTNMRSLLLAIGICADLQFSSCWARVVHSCCRCVCLASDRQWSSGVPQCSNIAVSVRCFNLLEYISLARACLSM